MTNEHDVGAAFAALTEATKALSSATSMMVAATEKLNQHAAMSNVCALRFDSLEKASQANTIAIRGANGGTGVLATVESVRNEQALMRKEISDLRSEVRAALENQDEKHEDTIELLRNDFTEFRKTLVGAGVTLFFTLLGILIKIFAG